MFIIWGKKRIERKIGYVAEFCPICRKPEIFELRRIGLAGHIYYISFGQGELAGHMARCTACGMEKQVEAARYLSIPATPDGGIEKLVRETFPNLPAVYSARLAIEEAINAARSVDNRDDLLMEPFIMMAPAVDQLYKSDIRMTKKSSIGCLGSVAFVVALLFIGPMIWKSDEGREMFVPIAGSAGALAIVYMGVEMVLNPGRVLRGKVIPNLARSLRPMQPTLAELDACLQRMRTAGHQIGKRVKAGQLLAHLQDRG